MSTYVVKSLALFVMIIAGQFAASPAATAATELLYVHDPACGYCREWERVIGPIYPKSAEGKLAPLRPMLIRDVPAAGLQLRSAVRYTPTFVLLVGGRELGRIEGYPGADFFWSLLAKLLDRIDPDVAPAPSFGAGVTPTAHAPKR